VKQELWFLSSVTSVELFRTTYQ